MAKIILSQEAMNYISIFGRITKVSAKDCIILDNKLIFVVNDINLGKAIGKQASNIKMLEKVLKKGVKIIGYNRDLSRFIKNLVYPNKAKDILINDKTVTIVPADRKTRGYMIGKGASTLRFYESIVKKYFDIEEIKVAGV